MNYRFTRWIWLLSACLIPLLSHGQGYPLAYLDPTHVYKLVNKQSGQALEVGGGDRYAQHHDVNVWPYWGGAHQQWQLETIGSPLNGTYTIRNRNSRQYLSHVYGSTRVEQDFNNNAPQQQQWVIESFQVGNVYAYRIRLNIPNGATYSLQSTSSGVNIVNTGGYGGATPTLNQLWDVVDVSRNPGVYRIINYNSGKALSANADDNRVTQWPMWYLAGQEWSFSDYNADGYLYIINRNTGQVLEIGGGGDLTQPGRTANLWDNYGHPWQQWALLDINDSHQLTVSEIATSGMRCKIYNRHSGKVLEIGGNGSELFQDDRAANQWYDWSGPNQQWNIYYDSANRGTASAPDNDERNPAKSGIGAASMPSRITLYPNPARTTVQIALSEHTETLHVTFTDAHGRVVQAPYQHGQADVSGLIPGLYIVTVSDGQQSYRHKFVKE